MAAFSFGALIGGRLNTVRVTHRGQLLAAACTFQAMPIVAALIIDIVAGKHLSGFAQYALIALLGIAMGTQNAVARKLAVPDLTTTVLTLTMTGISADARLAGGSGSRIGRRALAVLCMFLGALAGALLVRRANGALALALALALLAIVTATAALLSRGETAWSHPV